MKIVFKEVNRTAYIALTGELDDNSAKSTRESLDAIIETPDIKKVVLDMSKLEFMDSTGIGVLLGRFKILKSKGIPLLIANPSMVVDKILNLSGIYTYMPKISY